MDNGSATKAENKASLERYVWLEKLCDPRAYADFNDRAKEEATSQGGKIIHEYTLIHGFTSAKPPLNKMVLKNLTFHPQRRVSRRFGLHPQKRE